MRWPWLATPSHAPVELPQGTPEPAPLVSELDRIQRAERATRLLQDPIFEAIFNDLFETSYRAWLKTKPEEVREREELYRNVHALEIVRTKLRSYRSTGLMQEALRDQERAA